MSELKTKPNDGDVEAFLASVDNEKRKTDAQKLLTLMKQWTQLPPQMWGDSIVGFGSYHYKYKTGREGDWFLTGFSPRKANMTIYIMMGAEAYPELMQKLGKHKTGRSCLYINKLEDVALDVLEQLVKTSINSLKNYKFSD